MANATPRLEVTLQP